MDQISEFIDNYGPADRDRICFASNRRHGPSLRDDNLSFRLEVCRRVKDDAVGASDELIRDLYDAETECSAAAWSIRHEVVAQLASELLKRGGEDNLRHYLKCMVRGQDAYFSSLCVDITTEERGRSVAALDELISAGGQSLSNRWRSIREHLANGGAGPAA